MVEKSIIIYGTDWCGDCIRVRTVFDKNNIQYRWVDIDRDVEGERFVIRTNNGMRSVPTIVFENGTIIVEPTDYELKLILQSVQNPN
jgi:mycoredoxin